jgi:hypothetical protein
MTRSLKATNWQLNYDTEFKLLFVTGPTGSRLTIDEFLTNAPEASDPEAQSEVELLIVDMFPNEPAQWG